MTKRRCRPSTALAGPVVLAADRVGLEAPVGRLLEVPAALEDREDLAARVGLVRLRHHSQPNKSASSARGLTKARSEPVNELGSQ